MNTFLRTVAIVVVVCLAVVLILGAGSTVADGRGRILIGFAIEAMNGERWQTDLEGFTNRAKELGADVVTADARGDDEQQLKQVQDMIKAGIKALVLLPHDTNKASRIVDAAKAAGVKVVSYDRLVQNSDVDEYVSFDRVEIGRAQADYLVKHAPKGNYVVLAGSPNDEGAKVLRTAQMKVLQPYIVRGDIQVVADGFMKDWLPTEAYLATLKAIDASQGQIAAVLASNDGLAGGAIQALQEHGLAGKVLVTGQDADLAAVIAIAQGAQSMTVYKPVGNEAVVAAEEAVRLARGEPARATKTANNGKREVPAILLKPVVVTKENIKSTVVKDGFQTLKRINEGLPAGQQIQ